MNKQKLLWLGWAILFSVQCTFSQKVVFLHHSTGNNVFMEGNVQAEIAAINKTTGKSLVVTEKGFPDDPWPWSNYPYDYWKLWIDGSCKPDNPRIACMKSLVAAYDLIILKHCFPGADIMPDKGKPDVGSEEKTLENYKEQYRALRTLFDTYPATKFMVWTLAPLHRLSTTPEAAGRAHEFVEWVKHEWLSEDGKPHTNILIFDFFGQVAETGDSPVNGVRYCLRYEYERDHNDPDSHPNTVANLMAGPLFARAITGVFNE